MKNFMMWVVMPGLIVGMTYKMGYDSGRMSSDRIQRTALSDAPPFQGDSQQVHPPLKSSAPPVPPVPPVQPVQSVPRNKPAEVQLPQRIQGGTRVRADGSVYRPVPAAAVPPAQPKLAPMAPLASDYRGGQSVMPAASPEAFQQQLPVQVPCSDCEKKKQLEQQRKQLEQQRRTQQGQ